MNTTADVTSSTPDSVPEFSVEEQKELIRLSLGMDWTNSESNTRRIHEIHGNAERRKKATST